MSVTGFATTWFIARELGAAALGTYSLAVSLVGWGAVAANFGVHQAVRKRLSEHQGAPGHLGAGLLLQVGLVLAIAIVIYVFRSQIDSFLGIEAAFLVFGMVCFRVAHDFLEAVLDGQQKVHLASLLMPVWFTVRGAVQIGLIIAGVGVLGLLWGYIAGGVAMLTLGLHFVTLRTEAPSRRHIKEVINFAKYSWMSSVQGRAHHSLDIIVLGAFVQPTLIGIYQVGWNIGTLFATFGSSIQRSTFPAMSNEASKQRDAEVKRIFHDSLAFSGLLLIPGVVGATILGPQVLAVFGSEFRSGHFVLVVLSTGLLLSAYQKQMKNALDALEHPDETLRINVLYVVVNLILNITLVWQFGWTGAAVATATSAAVVLVVSYHRLNRYLDIEFPLQEISCQVLAALVMGGVVLAGEQVFGTGLVVGIGLVFVGAGVFFAVLLAISDTFETAVRANLPTAVTDRL